MCSTRIAVEGIAARAQQVDDLPERPVPGGRRPWARLALADRLGILDVCREAEAGAGPPRARQIAIIPSNPSPPDLALHMTAPPPRPGRFAGAAPAVTSAREKIRGSQDGWNGMRA